jgi:hypothetical protein
MKTILDDKHIAVIGHALDLSGAATVDCDSINMKNYKRATLVFCFDTLGTASAVLTINSGAADATITSALTFRYAFGSDAVGSADSDVLAAVSTSEALTITHGTYSDYMLVVDIDASEMDMANDEEWLTARFTDSGGATGTVDCFVILEPRYSNAQSASALA